MIGIAISGLDWQFTEAGETIEKLGILEEGVEARASCRRSFEPAGHGIVDFGGENFASQALVSLFKYFWAGNLL